MSLLDDVSIVVTPNGYKAGELYAVIPVPTEGSEEVVDSSFANDLDDWNNYGVTSATGGIATIGANANSGIYQTILTEGVRYTVTINVTSYDGVGLAQVTNGNGTVLYLITETGIQTFTFISAIASGQLIIRGLSNALFSVSNVSVKEYTSADMDVTRATAATRVDENGLVNYAEVIGGDLVTNGDFATDLSGWSNKSSTSTWVLGSARIDNSIGNANSGIFQDIGLVLGKTYTLTATLKLISADSNGNFVVLTSNSGGGGQTIIYTGNALVIGGASVTETIEFTTADSDVSIQLACNTTNAVFEIDNISVKEVTRDNVPRIDYTGGGCPHILAEPQRTNLVTESEDFTTWSIARATLGTNITAPNGEADGYSIIATAVNDDHFVYKSFSVVNTTVYTYSAYLKKGSKSWARLWNTSVGYADFDLENGVVGTQSSVVGSIDLLNNGWYRCSIVYTAVSTGINSHRIYTLDGDNDKTFLGDGSTINLYTFGAQLEAGSYATSYIPTIGSTVTRNQDIFTRDGIGSLINSEEGVLFVEMAALDTTIDSGYLSLNNGGNYQIRIGYLSGNIYIQIRINGAIPYAYSFVGTITDFNKIAVKWTDTTQKVYVNGSPVDSGTASTILPSGTLNNMEFAVNGVTPLFAKVKQLQVYDTALTDEQLLQLTGESGTDFYESYAEMASALTYTIQ